MYEFFEGIQMRECVRISLRNEKIRAGIPLGVEALIPKTKKKKKGREDSSDEETVQKVPIGYKLDDNFPLLPGSKPIN